ncbi:MAG: cytochrome c biogenesis protein CcsA [Pseudomonadota bacterium]|nr:cytochrome c biogenesis protein CcsA [Pseudomonadota bacterium]MEE3321480.1 cytochrome c biogenesis protein CcsA [Pseudomonadota bacterium]
MTLTVISGIAAFVLYTVASLIVFSQFRGQTQPSRQSILLPGSLALVAHGISLWSVMVTPNGLHLGLFAVASMVGATCVLAVLVSCLHRPFEWINAIAYPFAALTLPCMVLATQEGNIQPMAHGLGAHVLFSILAYSVLAIAAAQSVMVRIQDHQLREGHIRGIMRLFPPVQVMETMLFEAIWVGEILLTIAIASGFFYVDNLFAQHLVHKTVLTIIAWVVFATLLAGRYLRGWRGRTAIRFTLSGFGVLLVGFFGSQLVLEFILHR